MNCGNRREWDGKARQVATSGKKSKIRRKRYNNCLQLCGTRRKGEWNRRGASNEEKLEHGKGRETLRLLLNEHSDTCTWW